MPPRCIVIGGPNGSGKSTAAAGVLPPLLGRPVYVNADAIAVGLSPFHPEDAAMPAGRIMLERIKELSERRVDFAFETTLASRTFAPFVERCRAFGYEIHLFFFWLPSPDLAVARINAREASGGHGIEEDIVRRRYARCTVNFFELYLPLTHYWHAYDNSGAFPVLLAEGEGTAVTRIGDDAEWALLNKFRRWVQPPPSRSPQLRNEPT